MRRSQEVEHEMGRRDALVKELQNLAYQRRGKMTPADFLDRILANPAFLGQSIPEEKREIRELLKNLLEANLSGNKALEKFTREVTVGIPDSEFDRQILPSSALTLGDAFLLTMRAAGLFDFDVGSADEERESNDQVTAFKLAA